jgi:hypothetical protein
LPFLDLDDHQLGLAFAGSALLLALDQHVVVDVRHHQFDRVVDQL